MPNTPAPKKTVLKLSGRMITLPLYTPEPLAMDLPDKKIFKFLKKYGTSGASTYLNELALRYAERGNNRASNNVSRISEELEAALIESKGQE